MATKQDKSIEDSNTALAERPAQAVTMVEPDDYAADAGGGLEGATADSYAVPFLTVLQKGSPQVDEASGVAIPGAKQGMLYESVTGRMHDGHKGVLIVPCAYRRVFLRWGARGTEGGGFKGELTADQVAIMRDKGEIKDLDGKLYVPMADGSINEKKSDRISDTRNHYCLIVGEDGTWSTALLSLTSTQIKKSKLLASMIASRKVRTPAGVIQPASWASLVRVTTVPESNDKGNWYGVRFEFDGELLAPGSDLYRAGRGFNQLVAAGKAQAKYDDLEGDAAHAGDGDKF
jgi:hypothetical protein